MEIIHLKNKPNMPKIKMTCDAPIDKKLTEQGEAIEVCFSCPNFTIFCGGMASGKTTFLLSMLKGPLYRTHHHIYVIIPEISIQSISEKDNIFSGFNEENRQFVFHDFNEETLQHIYDEMIENAKQKEYSMLLIDDFGPQLKSDKRSQQLLERFVAKMRHIKCGQIWILCQNYYQMPKKLREMGTNVVAWNTNKSQNEKLFKEQFQIDEKKFLQLMKHCPTTHDYILLNLKYKRMFDKNWDEIIFHD